MRNKMHVIFAFGIKYSPASISWTVSGPALPETKTSFPILAPPYTRMSTVIVHEQFAPTVRRETEMQAAAFEQPGPLQILALLRTWRSRVPSPGQTRKPS